MHTQVIAFPKNVTFRAANDDRPSGPAGNVVSIRAVERKTRIVRTLRGVALVPGGLGAARAA